MTTGMLQENSTPSIPSGMGPKFRPYASPNHHVTKGRYITSNDPRGYIPVYEYPLNGQWIMMDIDDGYILWTGIWKALGNSKADIVKMIDSQPDLAPLIRRVRGGYLKIQGTWMPYEVALRLARRVAWPIREDLVPLFGPTFPGTCLSPTQPGYGQVVASTSGRRRAPRKSSLPNVSATSHSAWSVVTPRTSDGPPDHRLAAFPHSAYTSYPPQYAPFIADGHQQQEVLRSSSDHHSLSSPAPIQKDRVYNNRYSPYPNHSPPLASKQPNTLALQIPLTKFDHHSSSTHDIALPPISPATSSRNVGSSYALPPISALEDLRGVDVNDSAAVLRRLSQNDDSDAWPTRTDFVKLPSAWPTAPSTLTHRLSEPTIYRSYSPRGRLSISLSSEDSSSSHPSPVSPPSPATPLTPQSLSGKDAYPPNFSQLPSQHGQPRKEILSDVSGSLCAPRSRSIVDHECSNSQDDGGSGYRQQRFRPW